jgi:hypothetical protein
MMTILIKDSDTVLLFFFLGGGPGGTESTITEATTGVLYHRWMLDDDCGAVGGLTA